MWGSVNSIRSMKNVAMSPLLLLLGSCSGERDAHSEDIRKIESRLTLPDGTGPLSSYARYYAPDGSQVLAVFVAGADEGDPQINLPIGRTRWVSSPAALPKVFDGGCSIVNIVWNKSTQTVEEVYCNGVA